MDEFPRLRARMVERQIAGRGIRDRHVLDALSTVPREAFVEPALGERAYDDTPLPIEAGQTISQPYMVALMIEAAGIRPGDRALEIGAGSGYAAAVMAQIAAEVFAIERHAELAHLAAERMRRLGYDNVVILHADGSSGWPEEAPFDAILVAASGPHVPDVLKHQLAIGGRLVMPVGEPQGVQSLMKVVRTNTKDFTRENLGAVRFVPLLGAHGWDDSGP
jgi:protein-L-isoaspartate(D-aspartate) O-methyltransferase